jgi:integrase
MKAKLTKRMIDALEPAGTDTFVWDKDLKGFGLKITPAGTRVYLVQSRLKGHLRRFTIGKHGSPWTPDQARKRANDLLQALAHDLDPGAEKLAAKRGLTLSQLCDLYLAEGCATKKASTVIVDRGRIKRHIKPLLGNKKVADITRVDLERFMAAVTSGKTATDVRTGRHGRARVTGGRGTATRTMGLLGAILSFAVVRGLRPDNPARCIRRYRGRHLERFLKDTELNRLAGALEAAQAEGVNPYAIAAIKLLLLTGMRKNEVLSLRHSWVDSQRGLLKLPDSKTGAKVVPVGPAALQLIESLRSVVENPHVFPGAKPGGHLTGLQKIWVRIRTDAGLSDLRLHDLRHHFISVGASSGESLYILGKVAGHRQASTTQRYAHLADNPVRAAAERISNLIEKTLQPSVIP